MDSKNSLPYLCNYFCTLQGRILKSVHASSEDIDLKEIRSALVSNEFRNLWQCFTKKSMEFIQRLIDFYTSKLDNIIRNLKNIKISSHLEEDKIIDAMEEYEKYISLLFQIKLEIDYLDTGAINCKGHQNEMMLLKAKMDRSTNLELMGMTKIEKEIIADHLNKIDETNQQNKHFSCLSLEGLRVLNTQFRVAFRFLSGTSLQADDFDLSYDPQFDNLLALRARVQIELFDRPRADLNNLNCIFYRKNIGAELLTLKVSYGIKKITKPKIIDIKEVEKCEITEFYMKRKIPAIFEDNVNSSLKRKRK